MVYANEYGFIGVRFIWHNFQAWQWNYLAFDVVRKPIQRSYLRVKNLKKAPTQAIVNYNE